MNHLSLASKTRRARASRIAFAVLAVGMAAAYFAAAARHVYLFDFKPLVALGVPMLFVFFGFSSLLYIRGRSLARGSAQVRSLYAAERAMQAAIWHVSGIILATSVYALLMRLGVTFDAREPSVEGLWLLLFLAPYALMQAGLLSFIRALWVIAPQFLRPVGALELRRRVEQ